jgi:hypothetical protein
MIGARPSQTCGGAPRVVAGQAVTEPCEGNAERVADVVGSESKLRLKEQIERMANSECSNSAWP